MPEQTQDLSALMQLQGNPDQSFTRQHPVISSLYTLANIAANTANPHTRLGNALGGLGRQIQMGQLMNKRNQFMQGVSQIAQSQASPDEKINAIVGLTAQHGTDYGFGVKDIVAQYGQQAQRGWQPKTQQEAIDFERSKAASRGWEPQSQEEALAYERAKAGIQAESPKVKATQARQNLVDSTKIREEFLNRPEVKEYVTINTQVRSMDSLLKKAQEGGLQNKAALDQALITMYNKLTDPNSVVRESEYARTPENLPLINRFQGAIQKIAKGGAGLTDADRAALVWGAKVIANERGRTYNEARQGYVDLAGQYGIDEPLITRGLNAHADYELDNPTILNTPQNRSSGSVSIDKKSSNNIQILKSKYGLK